MHFSLSKLVLLCGTNFTPNIICWTLNYLQFILLSNSLIVLPKPFPIPAQRGVSSPDLPWESQKFDFKLWCWLTPR